MALSFGRTFFDPLVAPRIGVLGLDALRIDYCLCNAAEIVAFDG